MHREVHQFTTVALKPANGTQHLVAIQLDAGDWHPIGGRRFRQGGCGRLRSGGFFLSVRRRHLHGSPTVGTGYFTADVFGRSVEPLPAESALEINIHFSFAGHFKSACRVLFVAQWLG